MDNGYFDFKVPFWNEIKGEYKAPYRFEEELLVELDKVFCVPQHRNARLYIERRGLTDRNEMAQVLYKYVRYGQDNISSIGGALDNIVPQVTVAMWRRFIFNNGTHYGRTSGYTRYYAAHVAKLRVGVGRLLELMQVAIKDKAYIMHYDDMVKQRHGLGLHERKVGYTDKALNYYDSLD